MAEAKTERKFTQNKIFYDSLLENGKKLTDSATPEQIAYLAQSRKILYESPPEKIYEDEMGANLTNMPILPGTHPFLYCRMRRGGRGYYGYSTKEEMGVLNKTETAPKMFKNFIGGNDSPIDAYTISPSLQFVGTEARWLQSEGWQECWVGSNPYNYSSYDLILIFIKNTKEFPLTRTFYRYLSCDSVNADYTSASAYVGTPNEVNDKRDSISSIEWVQVHTKSADSNGEEASFAITIPAGKTIALLFNSCSNYYHNNSNYGHLTFFSAIGIYDFGKFLTEGLEVDHERTLKALQHKTINIYEIWR